MASTVFCKDGSVITVTGNVISVSNGEMYNYTGMALTGNGLNNYNVQSLDEAIGIIIGLHGGRQF